MKQSSLLQVQESLAMLDVAHQLASGRTRAPKPSLEAGGVRSGCASPHRPARPIENRPRGPGFGTLQAQKKNQSEAFKAHLVDRLHAEEP